MRVFIIVIYFFLTVLQVYSQTRGRSAIVLADTASNKKDSIGVRDSLDILISPDAPDAEVEYSSDDSSYLDAQQKMFYLFGNAKVTYQSYTLTAAMIRLDMNENIAYAEGVLDTNGKRIGLPHFSDGDQEFDAVKMRYNFKTRKGIIDEIVSHYTDVFIRGTKTKFIGGDPVDTTQKDIIFNKNAILTTCNAEHPHFGIRSTKQKFVKDKMVIVGPSNLEIMGVPTPIWLPFGFFPISNKRSAGLIIPSDYEYSPSLGFGLRDIGFYTPLGPHFDLSTQFDIYTRGSWGIKLGSNYSKRYKFSGNFDFGYSDRKYESGESAVLQNEKSYNIRWSHRQASQSNPYRNFSASVNFQTNGYQQLNYNNASQVLNNSYSSNVNYTMQFPGKPISLSASMSHSQNTRDKSVILNLPNINLQMQRIYPLKRKLKSGDEKWYERVSFNYNSSVQSMVRATDTTFFNSSTLNNLASSFGVRHVASSDVNFRVMKYFNLSPSVNFREIWNLKNQEITNVNGSLDTLKRDTLNGFKAAHLFDAGISLNTSIYGTMKFKKGFIRGIRHTMRPSVSLNYTPSNDQYTKYYDTRNGRQAYSIFEGMTYNDIQPQGKQLGIGYNLTNIFEAKYLDKKDSTEKKFKLFDNIYMSGFYNFAADSFKWSPMSVSGATRFLGGLTTLNVNMSFDFYKKDDTGRRINELLAKSGQGLARLSNYSVNLGSNFSIQDIKDLIAKLKGQKPEEKDPAPEEDTENTPKKKRENPETFWQMFKGFYFNHNLSFGIDRNPVTGEEKFGVLANSINTQGSVQLTKNWAISVGNIGYDFKRKNISYPDFGFTRSLHCWQMTFSFQPDRGTYAFNLFANPGTFNFLKLPYRKNRFDPQDNL
ncbi:MAG: LPS-assembly protein LptD [Saprospiraceae bacterium]|nr:LPS-assembly protein LptD [Saprospiraceae bacterium]